MRICFFIGSMTFGGIGRISLNLIKEFIKKDIKIDLFLLKGGGEFIDEVPEEVDIYIVEGNTIKRIYKFISYLRRKRPDFSISTRQRLDLANIFCCLFSFSQTEPVITVHTNLTTEYIQSEMKNRIYPKSSKLFYKIPSKFIAVSKGVADNFANRTNVQRDKIQVINNPVYEPYNEVKDGSNLQIFKNLQAENENFIIGVGRFVKQKDLFTLIKAFSNIREEIDIPLVILGEGPQKEELQNFIEELSLTNHVYLLGFVDNPQYYMKEASVFVLSSKWEGLPTVLIEALGVGTSIVSTNCPSGPAEILDNGQYGQLVPVEDPEKMAKAIIGTLKDPVEPEILIDRAQDFSVPKIANEYLHYMKS